MPDIRYRKVHFYQYENNISFNDMNSDWIFFNEQLPLILDKSSLDNSKLPPSNLEYIRWEGSFVFTFR